MQTESYLFWLMVRHMNNTRTPLYKVGQIKKHFPVLGGVLRRTKGYVKALDGVDLEIFRGETVRIYIDRTNSLKNNKVDMSQDFKFIDS